MERLNDTGISTRIPQRVAERLAIVAQSNGRTLAGEIRHLIMLHVAAAPKVEVR